MVRVEGGRRTTRFERGRQKRAGHRWIGWCRQLCHTTTQVVGRKGKTRESNTTDTALSRI